MLDTITVVASKVEETVTQALAGVSAVRAWRGEYPGAPRVEASPAELTLGAASIEGDYVSIPCSGGDHGTYYYVEIDLVLDLDDDPILSVDGWLHVKDDDA